MSSKVLEKLYDKQYQHGEWAGSPWYQKLGKYIKTREEVVASLVPTGTQSLLDIGCGEGTLLFLLRTKVANLYGIDLLHRRLKIAQKKLKLAKNKRVKLLAHNVDDGLPFKENSFDVVSCVSVIEYVLDPISTIQEFRRVTKKGGLLIIEVPNLAYILERVRLMTGNLVGVANSVGWQGGRLHHFTFSSLEQLLKEEGFTIVRRANSGLLSDFRQVWISLLASDIIIVARKHS